MPSDPAQAVAGAPQPAEEPVTSRLRLSGVLDVAAAVALAGIAAAATALPAGTLRLALTLPIILVVPGYLLLQAVLVDRPTAAHLLLAVGLSLPVLALAALSTSFVDGGFRTGPIVVVVTMLCIALAAVALSRRWLRARQAAPA